MVTWRNSAAERHPRLTRWIVDPAFLVSGRVGADELGIEAGSLTYAAFLSIPPMLILGLSAAGWLFRNNPEAQQELIDRVTELIPGMQNLVTTQLQLKTVAQVGGGLLGLVGIVWAASGWAARVRHSLGVVFRTGLTGLMVGRFSAMLLGIPIVVALLAFFGASVAASALRESSTFDELIRQGSSALLALAAMVLFLLTYWLLTPASGVGGSEPRPRLREHLPGAVVMGIGFLLLEELGAMYVARVIARSTALYGAIGAVFGVLAFLYLLMWLFLLAAEISQAFREGVSTVSAS